MPSSEKSFIGLAPQSGKGSPETDDAAFKYLLFRQGGINPNNIVQPLGREIGGGSMMRDQVKLAVNAGGALEIIPRPETLGWFLYGAIGQVVTYGAYGGEDVMNDELLTLAGENEAAGLTDPATPSRLVVTGIPAGGSLTGTVTVNGTDENDAVISENFELNDANPVGGSLKFKTVTSVDTPPYTTDGDAIDIGVATAWRHRFTLPADQFTAPYFTVRSAPGDLWGEQFNDVRISGLGLNFAGAAFVDGGVQMLGREAIPDLDTSTWNAIAQVDSGPQMIAPVSDIEIPTGVDAKVLSGSVNWGLAIPLDEQYVVGSYFPEDLDIDQRSMAIQLNVKLTDKNLYEKMMYDPDQAGAWAAELFREADIKLELVSPQEIVAGSGVNYKVSIGADPSADNIVWSAAPVAPRAGRKVTMQMTGMVLGGTNPIQVDLFNDKSEYALPSA